MKRIDFMCLVFGCFAAVSAAAGDLWIIGGSGSEVFLDGESVGVVESADKGIRIPALATGEHTVSVVTDEVGSAEYGFKLGPAPTQIVVVEPGSMAGGHRDDGSVDVTVDQATGAVEITSNPKECTVRLGARKYSKRQPIMLFVGLPIGNHELRFESDGVVLPSAVAVQTGQSTQVKVDFSHNRVAVLAPPRDSEPPTEEKTPRAELECIEYWIEVLRTDNPEAVKAARGGLKEQGFPDYHQKLIVIDDDPSFLIFKLRVGPIKRNNMAQHVADLLKHGGFKTAWVLPAECDPSIARKVE
jgi:cell division septation protein DedD